MFFFVYVCMNVFRNQMVSLYNLIYFVIKGIFQTVSFGIKRMYKTCTIFLLPIKIYYYYYAIIHKLPYICIYV